MRKCKENATTFWRCYFHSTSNEEWNSNDRSLAAHTLTQMDISEDALLGLVCKRMKDVRHHHHLLGGHSFFFSFFLFSLTVQFAFYSMDYWLINLFCMRKWFAGLSYVISQHIFIAFSFSPSSSSLSFYWSDASKIQIWKSDNKHQSRIILYITKSGHR